MKNNIYKLLIIFFFINIINLNANETEQFNFDVTELKILDNGNIFKGNKRGVITTNDGLSIVANRFEYNKNLNLLNAFGDIKFYDKNEKVSIFTKKITYFKNEEKIITEGNSKAINENGIIITADKFRYNKILNKFNAYGDVKINNPIKNYTVYADEIIYLKNDQKISTKGKTTSIIQSKYTFESKDVTFLVNKNKLSSKKKATVKDLNSNFYQLNNFIYTMDDQQLKGNNIMVITNYNLPKSDQFFFSSGFINLDNKNFIAKDTVIKLHKNIFNNKDNDPRLKGVSSTSANNITTVKKGVFTSCKENKKCTPWSIEADKIVHDKNKKQMIYDNSIIKVYDIPVLYFPKFFHPGPSVKRQSGLLKPQINESSILGSSLYLPYFKVISESKDLTIRPTLFEKNVYMVNNEYRQENKHSSLIADFGFTKGYKSSLQKNKNSLFHFFTNFKKELQFDNFERSEMEISIEKVNNDSYLKVFENNLSDTPLQPKNRSILESSIDVVLDHEKYNLKTGFSSYENLTQRNSDRYSFVLPYYNFDKSFTTNNIDGIFNLNSNGNNSLKATNNLKSVIVNDLNYQSRDFISNNGFKNNFKFYFKNLNTVAKNDAKYKNSPQVSFSNIYEFSSSIPLTKKNDKFINTLSPKISYRVNPGNMKNQSDAERKIDTSNIFDINRLSLGDSFESGQSLTLGLNFKKENLNNSRYYDYTIATALRNKNNDKIPVSSTINNKNSNIFGSLKNTFSDHLYVDYDFSIDDEFNKFQYNSIASTFLVNNFITKFNFIEENSLIGNTNTISNTTSYNFKDSNFIRFATRKNRKIGLTEYYDLIYEYKNDCLTAGLKYRKSYYKDSELKPSENLLFTISLIPLSTYEQKIDK